MGGGGVWLRFWPPAVSSIICEEQLSNLHRDRCIYLVYTHIYSEKFRVIVG